MNGQSHLMPARDQPLTAAQLTDYFDDYDFTALRKVFIAMSPAEVIEQVMQSGLRGRGGAAFPTGIKWQTVSQQTEAQRYVVANGEEGEPGTFKDRVLLERDPLLLLEAMVICAYAVGAHQGYIYLNHQYKTVGDHLQTLIELMRGEDLLGTNIFGKGWDFDIEIRRGRQHYVSGEETALFQAIEGRRAEPTGRPPFPTEKGLWEKPTVINNVETFCCIPLIIRNGGDWFAAIGPADNTGPKLFSVSGDIKQPGVYESSMDITLRQLLDVAGGTQGDFRFAFISGPSGSLYLAADLDKPLTIANCVGNGTVIVCNDHRCAVDMGRNVTGFFHEEHCGQCLPGREAMQVVKQIMDNIDATPDLAAAQRRYQEMHELLLATSKCGLCSSGTGITPRLMQAFPGDFQAHQQGNCELCSG